MAVLSKKSESAYAGFLNGYIAGNLAANTPELHLHTDRIVQFLSELKSDIFKWELTEEQQTKFKSTFNSNALTLPISSYNDNKDYLSLGEAIYDLIDYITNNKPNLPSTTSFTLKKIVYHYLNIAKTAKNTAVSNQAKKIAEKFELSVN